MAKKGKGCLHQVCGAVAVLLAVAVAQQRETVVGFAIGFVMTFWHTKISPQMWYKDVTYFMQGPQSARTEQMFYAQPGESREAQICRTSMYTKFAEELHSGTIMSQISDPHVTLPMAERAEVYLQACLETLKGESFPEEAKQVLLALDPVPPPSQFHHNITHPWMNGRFVEFMLGSPMDKLYLEVQPLSELPKWEEERKRVLSELPSFERKSPEDLIKARVPQRIVDGFRELDLWPAKDTWIEAREIPAAMQQGLTAVFDATALCGRELFNLTVPQIAEMHGPLAQEIPAFKLQSSGLSGRTYDSLAELAARFTNWDAMGWQYYPDFGPFPDIEQIHLRNLRTTPSSWLLNFLIKLLTWNKDEVYEQAARQYFRHWFNNYRQMNTQTSVNIKRLPKLPVQDIHKNMGSPDWVERTWSLLWIGPVGDFWHYDEADNLLICLSGDLFVAVMEQNYTDIIAGTRNVGLGWNNLEGFYKRKNPGEVHWVDRNPWIRDVPIHFLKLEPGMGITVPSRTYHNVMALDGNRILLNCFMFPKWRTQSLGWFKEGTQSDTYRAMWHLKAASLWRLWDSKRIGGFFSGFKLEFF